MYLFNCSSSWVRFLSDFIMLLRIPIGVSTRVVMLRALPSEMARLLLLCRTFDIAVKNTEFSEFSFSYFCPPGSWSPVSWLSPFGL